HLAMSDEEADVLPNLPSTAAPTAHRGNDLLRQAVTHGKPPPPRPPSTMLHGRKRDLSELPWSDFFDKKHEVNIDGDTFNVYLKGEEGPIFYLLHGGGYSGLTWACFV
uniref:Protein phosphatase methylesterase-1 n=2 Tax=Caenorhabditis japonica TaxID=281687 RepID=A0A8R1ELU2_CAEJA